MGWPKHAARGAYEQTFELVPKQDQCEHVFVIVCVLLDRFELAVAAGGRAGLLGEPAALAPEPGRELNIGEVSQAAETFGIHAGMRMGEALSRCPRLALVPPDPMGVAEAWESALARLETLGAAVESLRPGEACFDASGLQRLHSGRVVQMLCDGYLAARGSERLRKVLSGARVGQGPTRFCAMVAAHGARVRRPQRVAGASRSRGATGRACCAAAPRPPRSSSRCNGSASRRWESSPHCRAAPSPIASGGPACWPTTSRALATPRCARASRASCCASRSSCPNQDPASSSGARWGC